MATELFCEHAPGHRVGAQPGPDGMWARFCYQAACTWREITGPGLPPTKTYIVEKPKDGAA